MSTIKSIAAAVVICMTCPPTLSHAGQLITGHWVLDGCTGDSFSGENNGAGFGTLPDPGKLVIEIAFATLEVTSLGGSISLPLPVYADGAVASPDEVFWSFWPLHSLCFSPEYDVRYEGGGTASVAAFGACPGGDPPSVIFTAIAIRTTNPVSVQSSTFGAIKALYQHTDEE